MSRCREGLGPLSMVSLVWIWAASEGPWPSPQQDADSDGENIDRYHLATSLDIRPFATGGTEDALASKSRGRGGVLNRHIPPFGALHAPKPNIG